MKRIVTTVLLLAFMGACGATTKKVHVADYISRQPQGVPQQVDDLDLIVTAGESLPAGEVMIPKTTDLNYIYLINPILVLSGTEEKSRDEEE